MNNEIDTSRGSAMAVTFIAGAVLGAGLALLLAPAAGSETRRRIGRTAQDLKSSVQDGFDHARDHLQKLQGGVREHVGELREDLSTAVASGREAFQREREARSSGSEPAKS